MCDEHFRIIRKLCEELEMLYEETRGAAGKEHLESAKRLKLRAVDAMSALQECSHRDAYLKLLYSPTPPPLGGALHAHLRSLIDDLHQR